MKLVIAEKPSVAKNIYPVIGATVKQHGYYEGNGYLVSWCFGHLVRLFLPNDYGEPWNGRMTFDQFPMLPEKWKFKVKDDCKEQFNLLKKLMNDASVTEVICATDADREGECIFRYVYGLAGCKKPAKRLWVSSMEESAIKEGFEHLKDDNAYHSLFQAGFSRAKADWLVGMNGSRLFSMRYRTSLTLGRVQTPTLAMIVKRDEDIANFVKQKYYTVALNCGNFTAESERIDDAGKAAAIQEKVNGKTAVISDLKKENKTVNPPKLYDLTTLQRDANKQYGYTAKQTLDATQSLYEAKLVTYPRTDSQYLTDDMEQTALQMVNIVFQKFSLGSPQSVNVKRCIKNAKVKGHHALLPTQKIANADISALPETQRNVLMLISMRLALATAEPHQYETIKAFVNCENEPFAATGRTVLKGGWKALEANIRRMLKMQTNEEEVKALPALSIGQSFSNATSKCVEHWTSPPKPYTEDTLLSAMEHAGQDEYDEENEKKGLGTPATRAAIIDALVQHEYVARKQTQLFATEKGHSLIQVVPEDVKSPKLTAEWEMQLQQIEHGQYSAVDFMRGITEFVTQICKTYGTTAETDSTTSFQSPSVALGNCPHCGKEVKKGKFGFYCTGKCGMNIAKVYGKELTEAQITKLLSGKQISFTFNGKKTIVLPIAEQNDYQGKTYYNWKTGKGD